MNRTMLKGILLLLIAGVLAGCQTGKSPLIRTTDVANFWEAYDRIQSTKDTALQQRYLDSLYFQRGTPGLEAIRAARDYTVADYLTAIHDYPRFWAAVRPNTLKADKYARELEKGITALRKVYPTLRPARIYFTIGALRTNGTTVDSMVLIGSELAMADARTPSAEFPDATRVGRRAYFDSNPLQDVVLLNVHEYVHTQQLPAVNNLLSYAIREGVAEFVSTHALGIASPVPAVKYGKEHPTVREAFERELYYGNNLSDWLWSDRSNTFGMRDLGYYIGFQISENYYTQAVDKKTAIATLIELDYANETAVDSVVAVSGFFSRSLEELYWDFEARRPTVTSIGPFANGDKSVDPDINTMTITFSEPLNPEYSNFDYGPMGEEGLARLAGVVGWSGNGRSVTVALEALTPNKKYQILVGSGFRNPDGVPLRPYLISFTTASQ